MMYMMTPEAYKQAVDAAESNAEYAEAEYLERREFWGEALGYRWKNLQAASEQAKSTLAMLTAMKPVSPCAVVAKDGFAQISVGWQKLAEHNDYLYTPTKD